MNPSLAVAAMPTELSDAYRLVEHDLDAVFALIHESLADRNRQVSEILDYSFKLGGKRLRPLLVLLAGKATGELTENHTRAAAALEMIHTGTLVHDDILDGASFRRHLETLHVRWDSKTAVLAGDYLLTRAISLITATSELACCNTVAAACRTTCEGELLQTVSQGDFSLSIADYERIIGGKTASLLECSTRLGAYFSGADETAVGQFGLFGRSLGMAFQILDDLLDLTGSTQIMGKTLGTDLRGHKPTLPVILYLRDADASAKKLMLERLERDALSDDDCVFILRRLDESGSLAAARRTAEEYVAAGLNALDLTRTAYNGLPAAYEALESLARFVLSRNC